MTHQAHNYQTLLDVLHNHVVDMVVLDLNLPGTSGYAAGADIYFAKPVDPDELLAVVHRLAATS